MIKFDNLIETLGTSQTTVAKASRLQLASALYESNTNINQTLNAMSKLINYFLIKRSLRYKSHWFLMVIFCDLSDNDIKHSFSF